MSTDMDSADDNTPQDDQKEKKFTRGPIFDIMSDEEIEDASARIMSMIEGAESSADDEASGSEDKEIS